MDPDVIGRAFFRRAVTRKQSYGCNKNYNCVITKDTRKACQACRLKACLSVGMKEDMVMTEEEKKDKKKRAGMKSFTSEIKHNRIPDTWKAYPDPWICKVKY